MKTSAVPKFWPIERKKRKFAIKPRGPFKKSLSIPVGVIIRDVLKLATTLREVKSILNRNLVKINGKLVKKENLAAGLMSIVTLGEENYRLLPSKKGLSIQKIDNKETLVLSRIQSKTYVKGKVQLNLHDGNNIIIDKNDYKTGDVLVLENNKIKDVLKFKKDAIAIITGGNNIGSTGKIQDVIITKSPQENLVIIEVGKEKLSIPKKYIFVIGEKKPVISLGEEQ